MLTRNILLKKHSKDRRCQLHMDHLVWTLALGPSEKIREGYQVVLTEQYRTRTWLFVGLSSPQT